MEIPKEVAEYVRDCRASKLPDARIRELLLASGWSAEIAGIALDAVPAAKKAAAARNAPQRSHAVATALGAVLVLGVAAAGGYGYYAIHKDDGAAPSAAPAAPTPEASASAHPDSDGPGFVVAVSPKKDAYAPGDTVTVTVTPDDGVSLRSVTVSAPGFSGLLTTAPFETDITIPSDASGSYAISLSGQHGDDVTATGDVGYGDVTLPIAAN